MGYMKVNSDHIWGLSQENWHERHLDYFAEGQFLRVSKLSDRSCGVVSTLDQHSELLAIKSPHTKM